MSDTLTTDFNFDRGQRALLERIAQGSVLADTLIDLVELVEGQAEGMLCSVLLVDAQRGTVHPIAAPSLPEEFTRVLDGCKIGPEEGSCGAAAYRRERVIVTDIATHPYWRGYRALALPNGLRACWSSPIFSPEREVLGTFAMYYQVPRGPTQIEKAWVDAATHLAAIAIVRHHKEQAQLAREAQRALMFRSVSDVIFYLEVEPGEVYRFASVNHAFLDTTGLREQDIVGKTIDDVIPEPSRALVRGKYAEAIARRAPISWDETSRYPTGEKHGEVTVTPVFGPDGRCTHIVGSVHDVTARVRAAQEREREAKAQLEAQRLQSLGTLASGIAHDFNNILMAVRGHTELALPEAEEGSMLKSSLEEVRRACLRAEALVRQILTFGRQHKPQRQRIDLRSVVAEAVALLRPTLPSTITLETIVPSQPLDVLADPTQVHQLLMNLATNAMHAMEGKRGAIEVVLEVIELDAEAARVRSGTRPGRYASLCVSDQGSGMSDETLARAFEPFFTTKRADEGTGLGLSVVHGIMLSHEGGIRVLSAPDRGTRVELFFPM